MKYIGTNLNGSTFDADNLAFCLQLEITRRFPNIASIKEAGTDKIVWVRNWGT